jgi:hypothetical protein
LGVNKATTVFPAGISPAETDPLVADLTAELAGALGETDSVVPPAIEQSTPIQPNITINLSIGEEQLSNLRKQIETLREMIAGLVASVQRMAREAEPAPAKDPLQSLDDVFSTKSKRS